MATGPEKQIALRRAIVAAAARGDAALPLALKRGTCWQLLLDVVEVSGAAYLRHVSLGPSPTAGDINSDVSRTMRARDGVVAVDRASLQRLLNAWSWSRSGARAAAEPAGAGYVQGINVLAAVLLSVMSEPAAFVALSSFVDARCPRYFVPNLDGVHSGCALVETCLSHVDPALAAHLAAKHCRARVWAFPLLISFWGCVPPLEQVHLLWDSLLSFGVPLGVLLCVAQCVVLRDTLLAGSSPLRHLSPPRHLPPLDAAPLLKAAHALAARLPEDLLRDLLRHPLAGPAPPRARARVAMATTMAVTTTVVGAAGAGAGGDDGGAVPHRARACGYR